MYPDAFVDGLEYLLVDAHTLFDPLTGLPGPALVLDRIDVALARARRMRHRVGVFVLYDACVAGSRALSVQALATMLRTDVRPDDTIARVASRTFVVVCNDLERDEDAEGILERLLGHVDDACRIGMALGTPFDRARDVLARATNRAVTAVPKGRSRRWPTTDCRKSHFARRAG
jgi:GGDEF domain-containing protein